MYGGGVCVFVISVDRAYLKRLSDGSEFLPCVVSGAEPILLTEEMLELNGWELSLSCEFYTHKSCKNLKLSNLLGVPSISCFGKINILHYVHEFQHALRLCGLNEFADNFKVE